MELRLCEWPRAFPNLQRIGNNCSIYLLGTAQRIFERHRLLTVSFSNAL